MTRKGAFPEKASAARSFYKPDVRFSLFIMLGKVRPAAINAKEHKRKRICSRPESLIKALENEREKNARKSFNYPGALAGFSVSAFSACAFKGRLLRIGAEFFPAGFDGLAEGPF